MVNAHVTADASVYCGTGHINKLLNAYLSKAILSISPELRNCLNPKFAPLTAAEYIRVYEETFPNGTRNNCFIPPEVLAKFTDIYGSLKYYLNVLACNDKSEKNLNAHLEFMSQLGFSVSKLRKYFDAAHDRYRLFEALHYFIFDSLPLNETDSLILRHHLNYSNEYALANGDELPGRPDIDPKYLNHLSAVLERAIAKHIFSFTILLPWFDYGEKLNLTNDFILLSPGCLDNINSKEKTGYLTLQFLMVVLSEIYAYEPFIIITDSGVYYNLIKKELKDEMGIPPNRNKLIIKNNDNEPGWRSVLEKMFLLMYKNMI